MQVKVHPLFVVLALVLIACGQALTGLWTFLAVTCHELGHATVARARGYVVNTLTVLPFGAVMSSSDNFDKASAVLIGLAGPCVNAVLALITLGLWWIIPSAYEFTRLFLYANVSLCVFNLLPIYPLDGSRVVLGLAKNRMLAVKGLRIAGVIVSLAMFGLFIASAFYSANFTLGIVAVFLFYGAVFEAKEENYVSVFAPSSKDYSGGVLRREVKIACDTPIARFFHFVNPYSSTCFLLVDRDGNVTDCITEEDLRGIAVSNKLSTPIFKALNKRI